MGGRSRLRLPHSLDAPVPRERLLELALRDVPVSGGVGEHQRVELVAEQRPGLSLGVPRVRRVRPVRLGLASGRAPNVANAPNAEYAVEGVLELLPLVPPDGFAVDPDGLRLD